MLRWVHVFSLKRAGSWIGEFELLVNVSVQMAWHPIQRVLSLFMPGVPDHERDRRTKG